MTQNHFPHTSGPWVYDNGKNHRLFPHVTLPKKRGTIGSDHAQIVINVSHNQEEESIHANAILVSLAPEMIEALAKVITCGNRNLDAAKRVARMQEIAGEVIDKYWAMIKEDEKHIKA